MSESLPPKILPFVSKTATGSELQFQLEVYENKKHVSYVVRELFREDSLVAIGKVRPGNILVTTACNHYFLRKIGVTEFDLHKDLSAAFYTAIETEEQIEADKVEMKGKNKDWDLL